MSETFTITVLDNMIDIEDEEWILTDQPTVKESESESDLRCSAMVKRRLNVASLALIEAVTLADIRLRDENPDSLDELCDLVANDPLDLQLLSYGIRILVNFPEATPNALLERAVRVSNKLAAARDAELGL